MRAVTVGLLLVASSSGCGAYRSYAPPPVLGEPDVDERAVRTLGPLELALSLRFVGANDGAPMLTLRMRNSGFEGVPIDVGKLAITGFAATGTRPLYLVDPRGEIERLTVEPGVTATERIRLADESRSKGELARVCIDPTRMLGAPTRAVCFAPTDDAVWAVSP